MEATRWKVFHSVTARCTGSDLEFYLLDCERAISKKLIQTCSVFPNQQKDSNVFVQLYNTRLVLIRLTIYERETGGRRTHDGWINQG